MDVLRADAHADEACEQTTQKAEAPGETGKERRLHGAGIAKKPIEYAVRLNLEELRDTGGKLAATLDAGEEGLGNACGGHECEQGLGEDVGGGDGVLDGEIDTDAADRRHGVRGVADAEQARSVPLLEAVDLHGEQFHLLPRGELIDTGLAAGAGLAEKGDELGDIAAERIEARRLDGGRESAFPNDVAALEVVAAVDGNEHAAKVDVTKAFFGVVLTARYAEPEHVDGHAPLDVLEVGGLCGDGVPAVAADGELCADLDGSVGRVGGGADDAAALFEEASDFVLHTEGEAGIAAALGGEEVEEVPLRHERDEGGVDRQAGEVGHGARDPADDGADAINLLVRQAEQRLEEAELVHDLECRGVDGIAAKVAVEVLVLLEHGDGDTGAGEEQTEHDAGGAAAHDAARGGTGFRLRTWLGGLTFRRVWNLAWTHLWTHAPHCTVSRRQAAIFPDGTTTVVVGGGTPPPGQFAK